MGAKKTIHTLEFQQRAVELARKWDGNQEALARQLGVTSRTIRRWLRRTEAEEAVIEAREAGLVPLRDLHVKRLERQIAQLTETNAALQESVRFLAARRQK